MTNRRRERQRRPARRAARKDPKRRLLLVCEGEVTEPQYFRGFERWARNNTVEIDIADEHGVPLTLVRRAEKRKQEADNAADKEADSFLRYDEVWCVFDVDAHPHLNEARQLARSRGIALAVSNPCFELWLLLHFRENPGARQRHDVQRLLREHIAGYCKHLPFDVLKPGIADAENRAMRLHDDAEREGESGRNPSTDVFRLTGSIRGEAR
ncbi:RloB family protein [Thiohalocapsa sp. ML1]|jgi:hypothetical protein|uniref:RloB family protein n=1 Tax=Thiohalocapsa sp. ML1 TaxID=1431688 RepID=UPI0007321088|nr:RloB family protein [Thiohalocapsa sp. ML1]